MLFKLASTVEKRFPNSEAHQSPVELGEERAGLAPETVWGPGRHILELDGLRGFAILIVTINRFAKYVPTETKVGAALSELVHFGERGVDLFFVLSGFLITGVLLEAREKEHYFRNFFARRTLRIFPLYFASLFLFLVVIPAFWPQSHPFEAAKDQQFFLWTYLANVRIALQGEWCMGSLDHFWSLAVEEHFYLLWPFAILIWGRSKALPFAVMFAAGCGISRIAYATFYENGVASDVMSVFRFDGLLLGSATACLVRGEKPIKSYRKWALLGFALSALMIVVLELLGGRVFTITHSAWAIFWTCFLLVLISGTRNSKTALILRGPGLRTLGKYSYAMYIFQSPLMPLASSLVSVAGIAAVLQMDPTSAVTPTLLYTLIMFAVTYIVAIYSWNFMEKHCLKLKKFF